MIENYLIESGLGCGTVKNFQTEILKNVKLGKTDRWYFKTPVKVSGNGLKTATLDLAFPFLCKQTDVDEKTVLSRLEILRKGYEDGLMFFFRSNKFIVPPDTANFSIIPFWATETTPRSERKDFAGIRIHILNAVIVVKYRNLTLVNAVEQTELYLLEQEQALLEIKLDKQIAFNASDAFDLLNQTDKDLLTDQTDAMVIYNDCLKARILILKS